MPPALSQSGNGIERRTRAKAALPTRPEVALTQGGADGPNGGPDNDQEDEEGEEEEYEDDDSEDGDTSGFLSKPKLPPHQFASRSLFDITRKCTC